VNNAKKTITNSSATRDSCLEIGLNGDNIQVIPFGVDTSFFKPLKPPKNEDKFQVLSVGYLIERKGFEYLIRAMKEVLVKHRNVKLKIVGSGPLEGKLKNLITELELENEVEIIKNVSDEELLRLYNLSDLFVLPSIIDSEGNTEGLGVVLLEAMACGLPVIGSDVGGIPDIIENNVTGILVPEKEVLELTNAIYILIEDEKLREKIVANVCNSVHDKFRWEKIAAEYLKVYDDM
jgi:glycosyltransferase involved in cell wall biosynthesis